MNTSDVHEKLSAARARLILERPFLGALVLRLETHEADASACPTTATDMRRLYFNREYIEALGSRQLEFVLAHEALHCALLHLLRRGARDKHRWDLACDLAINPLLVNEGLVPPSNAVTFFEYSGMTAEEIYPLLDENSEESAMDGHIEGNPEPKSPSQAAQDDGPAGSASNPTNAELGEQWQQHLASAAQRARMAGKLSGEMMRVVHAFLEPRLSWRSLLERVMRQAGRDDYSYMRPSRRDTDAILPGIKGALVSVACVVDVSGSISDRELQEFASEVDALKAQVNARVVLIACDSAVVQVPATFEPWDQLVLPMTLPKDGGTDFRPPFKWLEENAVVPDAVVYFTDGQGVFPEVEPDFAVTWLVKGNATVPWGQRIQLN